MALLRFIPIAGPAARDFPALQGMKAFNRAERSAEASGLTVEDSVHGRLGRLQLRRQPGLAPACRLLDFPKKGRRVFIHTRQSIHEWIGTQYLNEYELAPYLYACV